MKYDSPKQTTENESATRSLSGYHKNGHQKPSSRKWKTSISSNTLHYHYFLGWEPNSRAGGWANQTSRSQHTVFRNCEQCSPLPRRITRHDMTKFLRAYYPNHSPLCSLSPTKVSFDLLCARADLETKGWYLYYGITGSVCPVLQQAFLDNKTCLPCAT